MSEESVVLLRSEYDRLRKNQCACVRRCDSPSDTEPSVEFVPGLFLDLATDYGDDE